jgi:hypothetical protein
MSRRLTSTRKRQTNGPAAAAILAAGIGCFAFGALTTVEHTIAPGRDVLTLNPAVGSHSGTITVAVLVWVGAWCVLHGRWKGVQLDFARVFVGSLLLIVLGALGTFPPFYQAVSALIAALLGIQPPVS